MDNSKPPLVPAAPPSPSKSRRLRSIVLMLAAAWCPALPNPLTAADTLLLQEIVVRPSDAELIAIHNPTSEAIDLSNVFLADVAGYYLIVTGDDGIGGGLADFNARFPEGAIIMPGDTQCVSLAGSDAFVTWYGHLPTYEIKEDGGAPDSVPDMREALTDSIGDTTALSNSGEIIMLYQWDGLGDLVQDLDYAIWGDLDDAVDKTGVMIDGPDAGLTSSGYAPDTSAGIQDLMAFSAHDDNDSWQRTDLEEGAETSAGGNGATGHDETSENLSATWSVGSAQAVCNPAYEFVFGDGFETGVTTAWDRVVP